MTDDSSRWPVDEEHLVKLAMSEFGDERAEAERTVRALRDLHPDLRPHFARWARTGQVDCPVEASGYTIARFREEQRFPVMGCFLYMDGLLKQPQAILRLLRGVPSRLE